MSLLTDSKKTYKEALLKTTATATINPFVNPDGIPINLHIWSRILYFLIKINKNSKGMNFGGGCEYCVKYHNCSTKLCIPAFLSICRTFNHDGSLRNYLRPIAMGHRGFAMNVMLAISGIDNHTIRLRLMGKIQSRQGHGNSNNIFGLAWIRNTVVGQIHWEHLKLPIFFFSRQDKLTNDKGIPLPGVKIPMFYFREGSITRTNYQPSPPLIWKKSWISSEPAPVYGKTTYLVLGSPFNLLACSRKNLPMCLNLPKNQTNTTCAGGCWSGAKITQEYILQCGHNICKYCYLDYADSFCQSCKQYKKVFKDKVKDIRYPKTVYVTPVAKIQAHNVCYLVYPMESNMRYWINTKTRLNSETGQKVINFYTNIV